MRIYFENKSFDFRPEPEEAVEKSFVAVDVADLEPAKLLEKIGNDKYLRVVCADPQASFDAFCSRFPIIRAAGGLVENDEGGVLIITRKGWPDLPKGHSEEGETAEEAAVREVCEETGLQEVDIVAPLCVTNHFYNTYGRWEIKRTSWFLMHAGGETPCLTPQTDEQISAAEWLRGRRLWQAVDNSYSTIKEVFEKFLEIKIQ